MKYLYHILVFLLTFLSGSVVRALNLPVSGNWSAGAIEEDVTVDVTGNVYLKGTVVIRSGATLTINCADRKKIYHNVNTFVTSEADAMFKVDSGAKLVINNMDVFGTNALFTIPNPYDVENGQWQIETVKAYLEDQQNQSIHKYVNGGIFYVIGSLELNNVTVSDCYSASGAAIFRPDGGSGVQFGTIVINNSTICRCVSDEEGAAIRLGTQEKNTNTPESCAVTITGSKILQTISCFGSAEDDGELPKVGGAISSVAGCVSKLTMTESELAYNHNTKRGGAIQWSANRDANTVLSLTDVDIHHNHAYKGGGMAMLNGRVEMENSILHNNDVGMSGGGLYVINDVALEAEGCQFYENSSQTGAGIRSAGRGAVSYINCEIMRNRATSNGAGMYVDGAGPLTLRNLQICENECENNGGGLYCMKPTVAYDCAISNNKAKRGGGVFLTGAVLTFTGGEILNNTVETSKNHATGYQKQLEGFGGGVAVVDNSTLTLSKGSTSLKFYGNMATGGGGGDDLFVNGNSTNVTLPSVSDIDITEYPGIKRGLNWIEDYPTGDTNYADGTALAGAGHSSLRYRDAFAAEESQYSLAIPVEGITYQNKYMCLAFAREVLYVTLVRSGLVKGENAIYRVSRLDENGVQSLSDDGTLYSEVMLFGPEDATTPEIAATKSVTRRIALYSGKWKIEEIGWAWTYSREELVRQISGVTSMPDKTFVFSGSKLNETQEGYVHAEKYDEASVTNDFGSTTVEKDKASSPSSAGFENITDSGVSW